jgi:hypothetical protein
MPLLVLHAHEKVLCAHLFHLDIGSVTDQFVQSPGVATCAICQKATVRLQKLRKLREVAG